MSQREGEWIVHLVRDAGHELAEGRHLGGLHELRLRSLQVVVGDLERGVLLFELLEELGPRLGQLARRVDRGTPYLGHLQVRANARDHLARRERLHQIVVRARLQAREARVFTGPRRDQDHGHGAGAGIRPHRVQQGDAVHLGHHDVAEHQVGRRGERRCERGLTVRNQFRFPIG
jgi:hypothetical protein